MSERVFDIVLIGATGFTGRLTALYLLRNAGFHNNGMPVRIALAGRNAQKLATVRDELLREVPEAAVPELVLADSHDPASLAAMCSRTQVVITTVGPYMQHGEALVAACVEQGCDYVDLTGEPHFVERMRQQYGDKARAHGVRIVHCCGFDSIPHDIGAFYTLRALEKKLGTQACIESEIDLKGYVRAHGDFSGGTWQSAINAMAEWRSFMREHKAASHSRDNSRDVHQNERQLPHRIEDENAEKAWAFPLPTIDPVVVTNSARRYAFYGKRFRYGHYVVGRSLPKLLVGAAGIMGVFLLAQTPPTLALLKKVRTSGEGPSAEKRATHWFTVTFEAEAQGYGRMLGHVRTRVSGGDPGYDDTAKMLAESALCLACDRERLPLCAGVITTAEAMGDALVDRLQRAGMRFEVL